MCLCGHGTGRRRRICTIRRMYAKAIIYIVKLSLGAAAAAVVLLYLY